MFEQYLPQPRPGHLWKDESGVWHSFGVFGIDEIYDFEGIVYIITRARFDGLFDPLYIGQSGQGGTRLSSHEKMAAARRLGATHVHILFVDGSVDRFSIETDLRRLHPTPLNEQPTPALAGLGALGAFSEGFFGGILGALPRPAPPAPTYTLGALNALGLGGNSPPFGSDVNELLQYLK
jgi:hypothetical protein